ncbi:MAG: efflux RND transporter periplasmic adaptor subunit [Anaerolineaceae bacterium]
MKHKRPIIPMIVVISLILLTAGYFGIKALVGEKQVALAASGTIEADEVAISPEISGKVVEVPVTEGAPVKAGDVLFRLDDSLLQAQRKVASANLAVAQSARLLAETVLATTATQSGDLRTSDWWLEGPDGYALPGWYFSQNENVTAQQVEVGAAEKALTETQAALDALLADPANADFLAAEKRLVNAKAAMLVITDVYNRANTALNGADLRTSAQDLYDAARNELDDAQSAYSDLKDGDGARKIITARADLAVAEERYQTAHDQLLGVQAGVNAINLAGPESTLRKAEISADQARLLETQAEANLGLIDTQISKLTVSAPSDGVILTSTVKIGEVIAAGSNAMLLGELSNLTITVYVPENLYGQIRLGQAAILSVDSFPGESFSAVVTRIADQAEFTPRNVQSVEGRSSTVYAITLQVNDPNGKLKPGMPADVTFDQAN